MCVHECGPNLKKGIFKKNIDLAYPDIEAV